MPDASLLTLAAGRPGAAVAGAVAGVAAGFGISFGNRWLERVEQVPPDRHAFGRWGPPLLLGLVVAALGAQQEWGANWEVALPIRALWAAVLVQVLFFDLAHRLILDRVLLPAAVLAFLASFVTPGLSWESSLIAGVGALAVFGAFALLGRLALRREALGLGDVKLVGFIGLALGVQGAVAALVAGVLLAGVVAVVLLVTRVRTLHDSIAYGPFLAVGALLGLFPNGLPPR